MSAALYSPKRIFQSTHPVRGATLSGIELPVNKGFQSTHPVRGATGLVIAVDRRLSISIHAPREGCDLIQDASKMTDIQFQSTHPVRGATLM